MSTRRDFMGMALGGFTAVGAVGGLYAAKRTWDPLPSVTEAGSTVVDLTQAKAGEPMTEKWRGKPIFVLKKTADMPAHDRDVVVNGDRYHVSIALCTHLQCIPLYKKADKQFFCACHGGAFDTSGVNLPGLPPPSPLKVPPFKIDGTTLVLGVEGPEYLEMKKNNLVA